MKPKSRTIIPASGLFQLDKAADLFHCRREKLSLGHDLPYLYRLLSL